MTNNGKIMRSWNMITPKSISHEFVSLSLFVAATMRIEMIKKQLSRKAAT